MMKHAAFATPGLRGILIQGAHGGWGDISGSSRGLSGAADLQWLLVNRAASDAVIVSASTAQRENYRPLSLRPELATARQSLGLSGVPALVLVTRNPDKIDTALEIADFVITTESGRSADHRVIAAGAVEIDWPVALAQLRELGFVRMTCEGGPALINALIESNQLDELSLTTSPFEAASSEVRTATADFLSSRHRRTLFEVDGFTFELVGSLPSWEERLTRSEHYVLRTHGTEPAFSAEYEKRPAPGHYICRACGNRLFEASDQFDARCGWPAFWQPSADARVRLIEDRSLGMRRVEVRCSACDSHLGHVFHGEGFGYPTDARYCINAICLERRY